MLPDMMPASEGVHGKVDVVRDTDTDKGEGVKKSKNLAGIISGSSLMSILGNSRTCSQLSVECACSMRKVQGSSPGGGPK